MNHLIQVVDQAQPPMRLAKLSQTSVGELNGLRKLEKQFGQPIKKPYIDKRQINRPDIIVPPKPQSGFRWGNYDTILKARPRLAKFFGGEFGS